jgi:hypothetical protein
MFWTIVIISVGIISPNIQYVGQFTEEAQCMNALTTLKNQTYPPQLKLTCVQFPEPPTSPASPSTPAPKVTPKESISSRDAKK